MVSLAGRPKPAVWLERAIEVVAPKWAASRERSRQAIGAWREYARLYEAAQHGRWSQNWRTARDGDANAPIEQGLQTLRARCRDLVRNAPYARRGVDVLVDRTLGTGITPVFSGPKQAKERIESAWAEWAGNPIDSQGILTFHQVQRLAFRSVVESGETIALRGYQGLGKVPLQVDVLEPDYCDHSLTTGKKDDGSQIVQGVQFNGQGRRTNLHLFSDHPGSATNYGSAFRRDLRAVPVEDALMVFRTDRPGQVRGVPWLSPVVVEVKDLKDYMTTKLMREKIAACFVGFVRDNPQFIDPVADKKFDLPLRMEPGTLARLPTGTDISIANPPVPSGDDQFVRTHLLAIAVGLGISYQSLTGDLSQGNFSQGRLGALEMAITLAVARQMVKEQFLDQLMTWWLQAATIAGLPTANVGYRWSEPGKSLIDPQAESEANRIAVESGQKSPQQVIREGGTFPDPLDVIEETAAFYEAARSRGVLLSTDLQGKAEAEAEKAAAQAAAKPEPAKNGKPSRSALTGARNGSQGGLN